MLEGLVVAATLLFFMFDPFASLPIFISLTKDQSEEDMTRSANRAVLVAALLFVIFAIAGQQVLDLFGVTTDGFRIAGGVVLLMMAVEVIFGLELSKQKKSDVAWVIIATPVLSGPGVIATAILMVSMYDLPTVLLAGTFALMVTWVLLRNAAHIIRLLGHGTIEVMSRIIGLIIAALAVEYIVSGTIDYITNYLPAAVQWFIGLV
ncbi:MAG TPA: MarC family protein [Methanomassiliicoccales archaeon]|nr:MarC family protein [Methanomassiliicoccales archaeon]